MVLPFNSFTISNSLKKEKGNREFKSKRFYRVVCENTEVKGERDLKSDGTLKKERWRERTWGNVRKWKDSGKWVWEELRDKDV